MQTASFREFQETHLHFDVLDDDADAAEHHVDDIADAGTTFKCGEILLKQNEWKILFKCELCLIFETTSFEQFLVHSLDHYNLLVSPESVDDLMQQAMLKGADPPAGQELQSHDFLSESETCELDNDLMKEDQQETEENLCIEVLHDEDGQLYEINGDSCHTNNDEQTTESNETMPCMYEETLGGDDDSKDSEFLPYSDDDDDGGGVMVEAEVVEKNVQRVKRPAAKPIPAGVPVFTCDQCGKRFRWRERFELHMRRHNGIKPYECEFCGATFADTSNFNTHRKRHMGIKPHICEICQKGFTATSDLRRHMRSHTGERPYHCTECDRGFKTMALLNVHRRRHSNTRPYICATCGKGFFEGYHLKDHEVSHTNERPFMCTHCDSRFARRKALAQHMKLHASVKEYRCEQCGKEFAQRAGLVSHVKTHLR